MKTIFEHVEHVKGKPHHVRKRIAFSAAAFGTGAIAFVWLAVSLGSGVFALKGGASVENGEEKGSVTATAGTPTSQLAGVGAAGADSAAAYIEIVDAPAAAAPKKKAEQTTIPF